MACAFWTDPADDEPMTASFHQYSTWAEKAARDKEVLHPFIYMNYAHGGQDVMGGIGADNLKRMRDIRRAYDPQEIFRYYWKGGFKL